MAGSINLFQMRLLQFKLANNKEKSNFIFNWPYLKEGGVVGNLSKIISNWIDNHLKLSFENNSMNLIILHLSLKKYKLQNITFCQLAWNLHVRSQKAG